jgi:hypothetical protein
MSMGEGASQANGTTIGKGGRTMEPWGIIMTAFTMFGMLVLMVAAVGTSEDESQAMATPHKGEMTAKPVDVRKAA